MDILSERFNKDLLIKEFKDVVADTEYLLKATANISGDKIVEIRADLEESLSVAKARIQDIQNEILAKSKAVAKATDAYVHDNPWRSIGFAASLGVVAGLLIGRR